MKIAIIGGGPAGLYLAYLLKRENSGNQVRVFERNTRGATFGFGVVFSDRALDFLRDDDGDTHDYLLPHMEVWPDLKIVHRDEPIAIDGNGFAAIGRLALLQLLERRCTDIGVTVAFDHPVVSLAAVREADLVVGADGVNSIVRETHADALASRVGALDNRFVWYGTSRIFDCLTLTFRENADGVFCAHHYRYSPEMSTFIVECDKETWRRAGFARLDAQRTRAYCEAVFAPELAGHPLISNKSIWRRFPSIWADRWSDGHAVVVGDALRTAHFSIGSGTRLAMEDAIALNRALGDTGADIPAALLRYEETRRPPVEKIVSGANASARWYERMAETTRLSPYDFAHDYMIRTGRVSDTRLQRIAPRFMARYLAGKAA